jgi:hypothetical protein
MAEVVQSWGLDVIAVDPLYLSLLDGSEMGSPGDLFFMGSKLLPLSELSQRTGVTVILLHHFRKGTSRAPRIAALVRAFLERVGILPRVSAFL